MNGLLIFLSTVFFCLNSTMTRLFQVNVENGKGIIRIYQAAFCLTAAMLNMLLYGICQIKLGSLVLSVLFGALFAAASYLCSVCYECGPMSLTSVIVNLSLAIPLIYSSAVYGEKIAIHRIPGLGLLAVTFVLSAKSGEKNGEKYTSVSRKWMFLVSLAFAANGVTAILQKENQLKFGETAGHMFLTVAYFVGAGAFAAIYIIERKIHNMHIRPSGGEFKSIPLFVLTAVLAGAGSILGNGILGMLSTKVNSAILYPCVNGGLAVMTAMISVIIFKEKITKLKFVSVIVGVAAIILLAI